MLQAWQDITGPDDFRCGYAIGNITAGIEVSLALGGVGKALQSAKTNNPIPGNLEFAKVITARQLSDWKSGQNPLLSGYPNATDAFITASKALPSGLSKSQIAQLVGISEKNIGAIIRFKLDSMKVLASPVNRNISGFAGKGLTSGGIPEFVIPNRPISSLAELILEALSNE